jgi:hypothetical protein
MNPQNIAKKPIITRRYLALKNVLRREPDFSIESLNKHKYDENKNNRNPWKISPNITPNKNGKVTIVNTAGFTSL